MSAQMNHGSRLVILAIGTASISLLGVASALDFTPRLVWNASASAPIGLYLIRDRAPEPGEFVLVTQNESLEKFITERGYLPKDVPLLKRAAALSGAQICRVGEAIFIDGMHIADALLFDSRARNMPVWERCFLLSETEIFLINAPENSLDGRYFGATDLRDVIGVARPLLVGESAR